MNLCGANMNVNYVFVGLFFFIIHSDFLLSETQKHDNLNHDSFIESAKQAWNDLKKEYNKGAEVKISLKNGDDAVTLSRVYVCGGYEINHEYKSGNVENESIEAINKDYAFQIMRPDASSQWEIKRIYDTPQHAREFYSQFDHGILPMSCLLYSGIMVDDCWIESIFSSDTLEITSLNETKNNSGDKNTIEVVFRCQHNLDKYNKILGGTFRFDMDNYFVILSCDYDLELSYTTKDKKEVNQKSHINEICDYETIDGIPFPRRITYKHSPINRPEIVSQIEFSSPLRKPLNKNEFYLTYYGFAEPSSPTSRGNTIRFTIVLIGILMIGAGLYFRHQAAKVKDGVS